MAPQVSPHECAVLFADIVGSTRLYETRGDQAAKVLITGLQDRIADTVALTGSIVQEIIGDEVMVRCDDVDAAVSSACAIQETAAAFSVEAGVELPVRIGLNHGSTIVEGERMFGDMVNVAARVAAMAKGGQIMLTEAVVERMTGDLKDAVRRFDVVRVKGKDEPVVVYDLPWGEIKFTTIVPLANAHDERILTLTYQDQKFRLDTATRNFSIGRDPACELVVNWRSVSRRHAVIEFNRDRFVLQDVSTNGTHVQLQTGQSLFLRRETLPMWGFGQIAFGAAMAEGVAHIVGYRCD